MSEKVGYTDYLGRKWESHQEFLGWVEEYVKFGSESYLRMPAAMELVAEIERLRGLLDRMGT